MKRLFTFLFLFYCIFLSVWIENNIFYPYFQRILTSWEKNHISLAVWRILWGDTSWHLSMPSSHGMWATLQTEGHISIPYGREYTGSRDMEICLFQKNHVTPPHSRNVGAPGQGRRRHPGHQRKSRLPHPESQMGQELEGRQVQWRVTTRSIGPTRVLSQLEEQQDGASSMPSPSWGIKKLTRVWTLCTACSLSATWGFLCSQTHVHSLHKI